jgi:hypothetical protein
MVALLRIGWTIGRFRRPTDEGDRLVLVLGDAIIVGAWFAFLVSA